MENFIPLHTNFLVQKRNIQLRKAIQTHKNKDPEKFKTDHIVSRKTKRKRKTKIQKNLERIALLPERSTELKRNCKIQSNSKVM